MRIPTDLARHGRALLRAVGGFLDEQDMLLDPHEEAVLVEAARVVDRLAQLRDVLDGADLADAATVRLLAEERQQRLALSTLLVVRLGLPTGLVGEGATPRSRRAKRAATDRWANAPGGTVVSDAAREAASARWRRRDGA